MRTRRVIVGAVDFGSRAIRVLIARRDGDGPIQIIGHGLAPANGCVSQGVIQDLTAAKVAFRAALTEAEKEARCRADAIFCGINGRNVETFIREGSLHVPHETVESAHMTEATDIASRDIAVAGKHIASSLLAQEWYVDDLRVADPRGIHAQTLKTRIHFARLPAVIQDNIGACVESQQRDMEDTIFLPLAAALGCLTAEDMELGVAVLDMGRSTTGLAVYRDYRILGTQCFEWGGYHITRDVAAGLRVSFEEADELVLEYGISDAFIRKDAGDDPAPPERTVPNGDRAAQLKLKTAVHGAPSIVDRAELDQIIWERARELMSKVRQHIHTKGLSKNLVRGIVLTGGCCTIRNYVALAESIFQVPCRIGLPTSVEILCHAVKSPEFAPAVGIVRHGFAVRAANMDGRADPGGPLGKLIRRIVRFLKRYFM
ncbi:MAG TPA: cell division protein FtsA [Candidatus Hydrogenedentes bacterium]|nr:cell division protein FtsA [Candidatus Hydrogenedentota bacterium]